MDSHTTTSNGGVQNMSKGVGGGDCLEVRTWAGKERKKLVGKKGSISQLSSLSALHELNLVKM